jgi:hypothetical protein
MRFSLRQDPATEAKIRRLQRGESGLDRLKPFIGTIGTGGANYSKETHRKYRDVIRQKHRARRARQRPRVGGSC